MKSIYSFTALFALILFSTSSILAVKPIKNTPVKQETTKELTKKEAKKLDKLEKRVAKRIEKMNAKADAGVDFNDPVEKWKWFWLFGWGGGLLFFIIGAAAGSAIIIALGSIAWLFGTVALIIWLVNKFS